MFVFEKMQISPAIVSAFWTISRGASAHDIFGTAVIVAAQAVDKSYLYPTRKDGPSA